jgi:RNA polymerase sigma-70 factor (ECF subfamily)
MSMLLADLMLPGHRFAYGLLQDAGEAEDAVQDAAVKAWRRLHQLRPGLPLKPWFFGIIANECRNRRRSRWWSLVLTSNLPGRAAEAASTNNVDILRALRRLDHLSRLIVVSRFYSDMTIAEIAEMTALPAGTVKSRLSRSLLKMRPSLELSEELR